jgi:hypothetical protein
MSNCEQSKKTFEEFKKLKTSFNREMAKLRETGKVSEEIYQIKESLEKKQKEMRPLLEKYFFKAKWSENIEEFGTHIRAFHSLPESKILVGGYKGALKILEFELDLDGLERDNSQ